jgi:hypothetical protein
VNVDGEWYPSLFHTVADYALRSEGQAWPRQPLPARGARSAQQAVRGIAQAALDGDIRRVIELLPPDEMAVLHDLGPLLVDALRGSSEPTGIRITDLRTETHEVPGGLRATVTAMSLQVPDNGTLSLTRRGQCYDLRGPSGHKRLCAEDFGKLVAEQADADNAVPPAVLRGIGRSLLERGIGVVTTEIGGAYYVSPMRTLSDLASTFLQGLRRGDLAAILPGPR